MKLGLFLEDIGHERLLYGLAARVADDSGVRWEITVLNASGGAPRRDEELRRFMDDYGRGDAPEFDVIVVARDTDCAGFRTVRRQMEDHVHESRYNGKVVFAIPEPHIECWYLADPPALQRALKSANLALVPDSRCGRDRFKQRLVQAVTDTGVIPTLGGIEYAEAIVAEMDIYRAGRKVKSLGRFIDDLKDAFGA